MSKFDDYKCGDLFVVLSNDTIIYSTDYFKNGEIILLLYNHTLYKFITIFHRGKISTGWNKERFNKNCSYKFWFKKIL